MYDDCVDVDIFVVVDVDWCLSVMVEVRGMWGQGRGALAGALGHVIGHVIGQVIGQVIGHVIAQVIGLVIG